MVQAFPRRNRAGPNTTSAETRAPVSSPRCRTFSMIGPASHRGSSVRSPASTTAPWKSPGDGRRSARHLCVGDAFRRLGSSVRQTGVGDTSVFSGKQRQRNRWRCQRRWKGSRYSHSGQQKSHGAAGDLDVFANFPVESCQLVDSPGKPARGNDRLLVLKTDE